MSYGQPSIASAVDKLKAKNCTKILFFPLYPQYASSSSGAAMDGLFKKLIKTRNIPEIRVIEIIMIIPLISMLLLILFKTTGLKWKIK